MDKANKEREGFEQEMRSRMFIKSDFRRDDLGHYKEDYMQHYWEVWQARAKLVENAGLLLALQAADEWISRAPHGDNCNLHDSGEFANCFCHKDDVLNVISKSIRAAEQAATNSPVELAAQFRAGYNSGVMNCVERDSTKLLEIARATGLRQFLHGVNATGAKELLSRFVDELVKTAKPIDDSSLAAGQAASTAPTPWTAATTLPPVEPGRRKGFIVACKRARLGVTHVFEATYLNEYMLCSSFDDETETPCTGWHIEIEDSDGSVFEPINRGGDEITHWMPLPAAPDFRATTGPEKGGDSHD